MKKIVFVTLMMADDMHKRHFPVEGNSFIEYPGEVYYAVNAVLAKTMQADDDIKIILLHTNAGDKAGSKNADLFKSELNELNTVGAKISFEEIAAEYVVSKNQFKTLYKKLIKYLEKDVELSADITFGPKSLPLLIFSTLQFGEKFFNCSIGNVVYQKIEMKGGKPVEGTQLLCDYTPLYLLNSFTNTIESSSGENAIAAVEALFED